jgi:inositol transport system substrate-binding protein
MMPCPRTVVLAALLGSILAACDGGPDGGAGGGGPRKLTIGVAFETLQTEGWVYAFDVLREEAQKHGIAMLEAIADGDSNRQFEQVRNFIARGVDGIIIAPRDAKAVIPMIKEANAAGIPVVCYNRPPEKTDAKHAAVVADNVKITRDTVEYMCQVARKTGRKHKAAILVGDLSDLNAIGRREGFHLAVKEHPDVVEVVSEIPTEWNQEKALAGLTNALQAHPDISFIFTSSDFMLPSIANALKNAGKWKKVGENGHVILGAFDGDATAYGMLVDGYLDADGVQDLRFESVEAVKAIVDWRAGRQPPERIHDPGFVIHQGNLKELAPRMWGANVGKAK